MILERAIAVAAACLLAACAVSGPAAPAQDKPVSADVISQLVVGRTVAIGPDTAAYGQDGSYSYKGGSFGRYRINDGRICVDFADGNARCDRIISDAGNYYLVTRGGQRFQFRPK